MSDFEELDQQIDTVMNAVTEYRRAYPNYISFTKRYTHVLAQMEVDRDKLTTANYEWERQPFRTRIFTRLNHVHGERVAAEGKGFEQNEAFDEGLKKMEMYRTILISRLNYIIHKTKSEKAKAAMRKIKKGRTKLDIVRDVHALVSCIRDFPEITGGLKPSGMDVNAGYLDLVTAEADKLMLTEGEASAADSPRSILVDKQNRLITLCMNEYDEMLIFAEGAFSHQKEYYKDNYTFRKSSKASKAIEEEGDDIIEEGSTDTEE